MDIGQKSFRGIIWSGVERFSIQIIQFVVQIIIARLLFPSDYGLIAMLAIFMAIAQSFTDGGFSNALIQKKDRNEKDYSTVFYFNIIVGFILAIIFFFSSGIIADFYNLSKLKLVVQVMSVNLIILSFQVIQKTILTINIDFLRQAKASLISVLIGGIVGISMAYFKCGVWALVGQFTTINLIQTILLWYFQKWRPKKEFSFSSFNKLFSFGSKILISNILQTIYLNLYTLVIGKKFSANVLGLYSRADQFAQFPSSNITSIIQRVSYPIMSSLQDDNEKLKAVYRKYINLSSFIISPLIIGLMAVAEPFIMVFLTQNWIGIVPIMQIICFYYLLYPQNAFLQSLMQAKGEGSLFLKTEIVKKILGVSILFISIPFGIYYLCWGLFLYSIISFSINIFYAKKLIGLKILDQIRDILKIFLISFIMGAVVYSINYINGINYYAKLIIEILIGVIVYYIICRLFGIKELKEITKIMRQYLHK
ncbi:MAG: lipopolysaccharide biosynthesis protein [Bacteroidales bacterium]|jgi:O-antigen/teichoic acid export membrane protein|nr:lipopolysaccharide biosynthesis protein [Bacteroidales bacterium]